MVQINAIKKENSECKIIFHLQINEIINVADVFRRVLRDISERGRDLEHVLHQYTTLVKPAFEEFCIPTKKYADVIIPRGAENVVAIDLIKQHIQDVICKSNGHKTVNFHERSRSNSDSTSR